MLLEVKIEFILCPVCKNKTRLKIREDTELKNFLPFYPECKNETLIDVRNLHITVIKESNAKTQSR
ncbi:MAG: cysteine-rich KTR domain-containing protein [Ruminococcus sp.]|nr:cysteine-rich KTR domain-containing protein [Ruminococcus sp.]